MKLFVPIATIFLPLVFATVDSDFFSDLDHQVYLDEDEYFSMSWSLINDTHMEIGVACENLGWCAIGLSPNGQMPGSDIDFFWIDDSDGTIYLQDRYAYGRSVPVYDSEQNVQLLSGGQTSNTSWVRFIRPQFSCDKQDNVVETGTSRVCYAYQENDPTQEFFDSDSVTYHDEKGSKSVNLLSGSGNEVELEDDVMVFNMTMDNYNVPDDDTTYYCKFFKLPETNDTQHIVKIAPIITEGNEGIVHHIIMYYCPSSYVSEEDIGVEEDCTIYQSMSVGSADCVFGINAYAWAIGGEEFYFPEGIGLEMSGTDNADGSELQYVLLEIHYDNPDEDDDWVDSSGISITYTPTLRDENAGLMQMGINVNGNHFVPGAMAAAQNFGYCGSSCTENGLPTDGVKVIASMLHAHNIGMALNLRHVRDGVELEPIDQNWNYDFDYQSMITHSGDDISTILPGDDLILECYYQTTDKDEMTWGGLASDDEMCFVYLYVYPKPELRYCRSTFSSSHVSSWRSRANELGYLSDNYYEYQTDLDGAKEFYQSLWWNGTSFIQSCEDQYGDSIISTSSVDKPEITDEYETEICGKTVGIDVFEYWYPTSTTPWVEPTTQSEEEEDTSIRIGCSSAVLFSLAVINTIVKML